MRSESHTVLGQATNRASTAADHDEQLEDGLTGIVCDHCAAEVRVKKNSPAHTSIQWTSAAVRACPRLAGQVAELGTSALVGGCDLLRECIEQAGREGRIAITGDSLRENTDD